MKELEDQNDCNTIYLPHHAVVRQDKDTTKVRVVFDASAKGSQGYSLNDTMLVGPVIQQDLRSLIITWRQHYICFVGDIMKMYRMVKMSEEHTKLQCIVWRDNSDEILKSYQLTTVTFGTAAAPFLAVRTLLRLADDECSSDIKYSEAMKAIKESFYVDDLMGGHEDVEKAKKLCVDIKEILEKGGFKIKKWSSNSEEVLQHIQENNKIEDSLEIKLDKVIKILGLTWDRREDAFKITVNLPLLTYPITKRSILSDIARLFDPFGWLSPVIIIAKTFIQKLWVVLSWLQSQPGRWHTFVANRVAEIQRYLNSSKWNHVQSYENPADVASRGVKSSELNNIELWWNGPEWLKHERIQILRNYSIPQTYEEEKEGSEIEGFYHTNILQEDEKPIWERFSTLNRLKRVISYCMRMKKGSKKLHITTEEMENTLQRCVHFYQERIYQKDIGDLKKERKVRPKSSLSTLCPFLDGILREGGKLQNAEISEVIQHPIILSQQV
ncbi:uncharacterized protein LOC123690524 [Pieris rapae]|uniref:uncharacterized protein LOC123690524 n=1 Tax=Pieris rapae TaxID=64459 RepID=UPI001E27E44F|nr:uncharacterized protein LOC123690524 [Pieris rapae]